MQLNRKLIMIISVSILGTLVVFTAIYVPLHYRLKTTEYVEHEPIVIWRDIDFIGYQFPGKGTAKDPYRIEKLNITTNDTAAIYISSTTKHFVIQNCLFTNIVGSGEFGIYIEYAGNGTVAIDSNEFDNYWDSIFIESSRKASISNNIGGRIELAYSDGAILYHNNLENEIELDYCNNSIIEENDIFGLDLYRSEYSTIVGNIFRYDLRISYSRETIVSDNLIRNPEYDDDRRNTYRIDFYRSPGSTFERNNGKGLFIKVDYSADFIFSNNKARNSELNLYDSRSSEIFYNEISTIICRESSGTKIWHNIFDFGGLEVIENELDSYLNYNVINNTVNGKLLGYFKQLNGDEFTTADYGQLIFVYCRNINILNQEISGTRGAIALYYCDYMDIVGNDLSENDKFGIVLSNTDNTLISENELNNNQDFAISIRNSHNIDVIDNEVLVTSDSIHYGEGINVEYSDSVDVIGNTVIGNSRDYRGINLWDSVSCTITDNICDGSDEGLRIIYSPNTLVSNNDIHSDVRGIYLDDSENSTVSNNVITGNAEYGIKLYYSKNSICNSNIISYGGIDVQDETLEDYMSYSFSDNEINGKEFGYLFNIHYVSFTSSDYAQLYLFNSSNIFITNQTFSNVIKGLVLFMCELIDIYEIECINNEIGIGYFVCNSSTILSSTFTNSVITNDFVYNWWWYFDYRMAGPVWNYGSGGPFHNLTIQNNLLINTYVDLRDIYYSTLDNNILFGSNINIYNSEYLTVFENQYYEGSSFQCSYSSSITIFNNINTNNSFYSATFDAIDIYDSDNITIFNNYIYGSMSNGVELRYSNNCSIFNNTILYVIYNGIIVGFSESSLIANNTCNYAYGSGISVYASTNITFTRNICNNNDLDGIHVFDSNNLNITDNICNFNLDTGIALSNSEYSEISNNYCDNNLLNGMYIADSTNIFISENNVSNSDNGIFLVGEPGWDSTTYDCEVFNNTIQYCLSGLVILDSEWIVISNNTCNNNIYEGMRVAGCHDMLITNNTAKFNTWGIIVGDTRYSTVSNNLCTNNSWSGVDMYWSDYITVINCNLSFNVVGLSDYYCQWNDYLNNTITYNSYNGIYLENTNSTLIAYNLISDNTWVGVMIASGHSNTLYYNAFVSNNIGDSQGYDDGVDNNWDNNYWSDWTSGDYHIIGSAGSIDYDPLVSNPL